MKFINCLHFIPLLLLLFINEIHSSPLEIVNDDDLINLFKNEKFVVVLFTKKDCEECDNLENELINLREDLVDTLNSWVVKSINSNLVKIYKPTKEPALVFFRHGVPLLYEGPVNDEVILHTFSQNKEPSVKELNDDNFEHLTQASSGFTTGDWFIMFYSSKSIECQRLQARWEAVGAKLKTRMNVARVNTLDAGVTSRRFNIQENPSFLLFRKGNLYRYNIKNYNIDAFSGFATDWYRNVRAESIPIPKSPFDDFTQMIADYLKEVPLVWKIVGLIPFIFIVFKLISSQKKPEKVKEKTKKKDRKD